MASVETILNDLKEQEKLLMEGSKAQLQELKIRREEVEAQLPESIQMRKEAQELDAKYDDLTHEIFRLKSQLSSVEDERTVVKRELKDIGPQYISPENYCKYFGHNVARSCYTFHCYRCGLQYDYDM